MGCPFTQNHHSKTDLGLGIASDWLYNRAPDALLKPSLGDGHDAR